jgi:predicted Rossmann fold nucleotide-binding protein DprA/Smf involved in DNA uptake
MLCAVWSLSAGTPAISQGRQETFAVARQMQDNGRVARNHRYQYRIAVHGGGIVVSPLAAETDPRSGWAWGLRLTGYGTPDHI